MLDRREAGALGARKAVATLTVIAGIAAYGELSSLEAADDDPSSRDIVLQPGIVEEISSPWRGRWRLFDGFDGRSPLHAAASFSGIWNDNVFITDTSPSGDLVFDTSLAVWFESSHPDDLQRNYVKVGYDPQILTYQDLDDLDAVNHRWFARYLYTGARVIARIDHRDAEYSDVSRVGGSTFTPTSALETETVSEAEGDTAQRDLTDAERDVGRRTQGTRQITTAFARINLTGVTAFRPAASRRYQEIEGIDFTEEFEEFWVEGILYRVSSRKLRLGLGPRFGWADFTDVNSQTYGQGLAHMRFRHSPKMLFDGMVGVDYREYGARGDHETTPLFLGRFTWAPSERTALSIEGFQRSRASFGGDAATDLGARLVWTQALFDRFEYSLRCGYVTSEFNAGTVDAGPQREDDFVFMRNALEYGIGEVADLAVFHEYRENTSNRRRDYQQGITGVSFGFEF